jgi:hypothetical protein
MAALAPAPAHAQCRFQDSGKASTLTYRFLPEARPDGSAVLHVTLQLSADSTGQRDLVIPTRWAGEDLSGVSNLHAKSPGSAVEIGAESKTATVRGRPNQSLVIGYDLKRDWTGPLVNPFQFHAVVMPDYVEFTGSNALVRPSFADGSDITVHFDWQNLPASWTLATSFGARPAIAG